LVLCYDGGVKESKLEPGLLRVFRWYVIVRGIFLAISISWNIFFGDVWEDKRGILGVDDLGLFALATSIELILLFFYLSWPPFRRVLGRYFLPIALTFSAAGLILEQYLFSSFFRLWQPLPFLYILLILVAWQYRFSAVLIFGIGATLLEIFLARLFMARIRGLPPFDIDMIVIYGRLAASVASYLVLGYVVNRLVQAQREQHQALADANLKLVQHASTVEQLSTSRERLRISRELHDTLAHTLSALAVQFDALATVWGSIPEKAQEMVEQMQSTTRSGLDETRRSLRALRESPLKEVGLVLALQGLAKDFAARHNLALQIDLPENLDGFPPEVEQCYYRVAQESLENIARHAAAKVLTIQMTKDSSGLTMTISDDGRGFDVLGDVTKEHLGLQGMQERAGLINAGLEVESSPGEGTTVRLRLLMENEAS